MKPHEVYHAGYLITDNPSRLDAETVYGYLSKESYWAKGVSRELVQRSLENSLCLGVYDAHGAQVGLARVISDYATFAYLCDVFILEGHRRRGLGKASLRAVLSHPKLQTIRRISLVTQDAQRLYAAFGFNPIANPERHMEKRFTGEGGSANTSR